MLMFFLNLFFSYVRTLLDKNLVVNAAPQTHLTYMDIYFKEDDLWILVTQHVESRSYSDTGSTPEETEESMFVICSGLSINDG